MRNIARCNLLKSATLALLMWASAALATETNTFTFTNKAGAVFQEVKILAVQPDGILYLGTNGTSGGKIKFSDLPAPIASRFGYDESKAKEFEASQREIEARNRSNTIARYLAAQKARAAAADLAKRKAEFLSTARRIKGPVIQIKDGELTVSVEFGPGGQPYPAGLSLPYIVRDFPNVSSLHQDEMIDVIGYAPTNVIGKNTAGFDTIWKSYTVRVPDEFRK